MSTVGEVMTCKVVTIRGDASLREAMVTLAGQHISGAAVTNGHQRLLGAISQSDIIEAEAELTDARERERFLDETTVSDLMSAPALTIEPEAELREAALSMEYADVHRLFVERNGRLVGVISRTDVSRAVASGAA